MESGREEGNEQEKSQGRTEEDGAEDSWVLKMRTKVFKCGGGSHVWLGVCLYMHVRATCVFVCRVTCVHRCVFV